MRKPAGAGQPIQALSEHPISAAFDELAPPPPLQMPGVVFDPQQGCPERPPRSDFDSLELGLAVGLGGALWPQDPCRQLVSDSPGLKPPIVSELLLL
ncbi:hypothetical protein HCN51_57460 [Nonomuraea sp. FMUSA5-5]|uniref:Uncharacterized protein n=1 Tax=Nonomuraea composti TaxID=2720023 RepID=A0ABX1BMD9_9ACTN|nr:hypothetical protein [Nonomuraea sp. FMUSA5-5]NJP98906.1 hypothetical protein [Nonomuraea sp. FMUSA5-5]